MMEHNNLYIGRYIVFRFKHKQCQQHFLLIKNILHFSLHVKLLLFISKKSFQNYLKTEQCQKI